MSSSICPHFTQNAWRKDLCSNCFKSKDEHKQASGSSSRSPFSFGSSKKHAAAAASLAAASSRTEADHKKTDFPNKHKTPAKSIIKKKSTATTTTTKSSKGSSSKAHKVSFPKNISEVIGYGGEWSDNDNDHDDDQYSDDDDDHDFMNLANERHQDDLAAASTDDEEALELKRITRANTDFNMNNGNLLGDPQENIKKSFAALKLGAPQVDKEGKKQTLKINVMPFGAAKSAVASAGDSSKQAAASNKVKFEPKTEAKADTTAKSSTKSGQVSGSTAAKKPSAGSAAIVSKASSLSSSSLSTSSLSTSSLSTSSASSLKAIADRTSDNDGTSSPPIERAMEKSLLDEISETLELKQNESKKLSAEKEAASVGSTSASASASKIKFEITSLTETLESKSSFLDLKKPIARNPPITKDHAKPKINVFHKYTTSDTDSNCSDTENGVSAYYDVVETQLSYENLPDGKCQPAERQQLQQQQQQQQVVAMSTETPNNASGSGSGSDSSGDSKSIFSSSQYITDMLLSSKTRAASYNLHEGNFMTSKITSDGLIVTKCSSDDALDSTGSSFDGSSEDEETSYNMIRSESDSGIGISISGNDYKNLGHHGQNLKLMEKERERQRVEKKLSASTNNSDYEDIQVADHQATSAPTTEGAKASPSPSATATNSTNSNAGSSSVSTSNLRPASSTFSLEKSRELHGEPDGSADPDGSLENNQTTMSSTPTSLPALPKSPPPTKTIDARPSFLHGLQKHHPPLLLKKPDLPAKPVVVSPVASPLKTFQASAKRQPTNVEQQVISQLQLVMSKSNENLAAGAVVDAAKDEAKLKQQLKGRAPNPPPTASSEPRSSAPPTPERDYNVVVEFAEHERQEQGEQQPKPTEVEDERKKPEATKTTSVTPAPPAATSVGAASAAGPSSIYTRKLPTLAVVGAGSGNGGAKNTASPVIREKDKRERATINPKFRSLNTFVTQRSNAAKNLQLQAATSSLSLKQPLTPEPTPRNPRNLSLSEECLAEVAATRATTTGSGHQSVSASSFDLSATPSSADKKPPSPQKTKSKFSIKKFLRMGASKTTDNLHKKDGVYSEICTGEDSGVVGKPRLVIIHPIDINPTAVEVVKDITKTGDAVAAQTVAVVTSKPPAPPLRSMDGQRPHELNKPARPPPPKSAELRRKQRGSNGTGAESGTGAGHATGNGPSSMGPELATPGSIKCKADNVYANLGEIRSSIAPRKPERTASMREREAQLELVRKRHHSGQSNDNTVDTVSICSSNGENVLAEQQQHHQQTAANILSSTASTLSPQLSVGGRGGGGGGGSSAVDGKPPSGSRTSTFERKKSDPKIASKLEIFESRSATAPINNNSNNNNTTNGSLKDSVRKINSTIDSYLKDKRDFENMYEFVKSPSSPSSPPPPPARSVDLGTAQRGNLPLPLPLPPATPRRGGLYSDTASVASYTRSEYGPARSYGLGFNGSLANIPRVISASYCGSEAGEFDIYSPYSYYGSEAGGDVATDINDSVWGIPSVIKNRAKATNRLRMRKGRSVVHKTIEDNYTAVVVANHEALAQVLDQLQQTPIIPPALRPLANAINLRFEDFTILDGAQAFVVGKKAFHAALWTTAPVTLALSADCNQLSGVGGELNQLSGGVSGVLNPITEFCDLVPSYHLPLMPSTEVTLLQATISVLPRLQLDTLQSIGGILKGKSQVLDKSNFNFRGSIPNLTAGLGLGSGTSSTSGLKDGGPVGSSALRNVMSVQNLTTLNEGESMDKEGDGEASASAASGTGNMPAFDDVMTREVAFIMLQLVNGMKNLQAKAIEEMPLSLSNVVLSKDAENKDAQARLCVLQGNNNDEDEPMGTLCKCAHIALTELLPTTKITPILADILLQERSESLSKSKSVLEFVLWGPSDVVLSGSTKERELALQRWLDLERATVLHGLVRTRVELTVYDECHLMFLVRSNAKMMNDAAKIVCHYQQQQQQHPHESRD